MISLPTTPEPIKSCKFRDDPVTAHVNDFDDSSAKDFRETVNEANNTGQPILPVVISSNGGKVAACLQMHSAIEKSEIPVLTYTPDRAYSCGFALLAFGTPGYRFVSPSAFTMAHQVSYGAIGKESEVENQVEFQKRQNEEFYRLLDEACDKENGFFSDFFEDKNNLNEFLSAEETVELNAADTIGRPQLTASISLEWTLKRKK